MVHLDQIWWEPGHWQHMSREEFDARLMTEMEKPQWILDGNFNRTLEARLQKCDTVIYLDLPRIVCLKSWIGRVIRNWGTARPDMAEGCCEWFDPEMAKWIWKFNKQNRKRYLQLLNGLEGKQIFIFRSRQEVKRFLEKL